MRIYDNGFYRDETPEEIAERENQEAEARREEEEAFWAMPYPERVDALIREKYTIADEIAINRQRETKPEEFEEYFAFCEDCKARAKNE